MSVVNSKSPAPMSVEEARIKRARVNLADAMNAQKAGLPYRVDYDDIRTLLSAYEESRTIICRAAHEPDLDNAIAVIEDYCPNDMVGFPDIIAEMRARITELESDFHLLDTGDEEMVTSDAGCYHEAKLSKGAVPLCYGENHRPFKSPVPSTGDEEMNYRRICTKCRRDADVCNCSFKSDEHADRCTKLIPVPDTEKVKAEDDLRTEARRRMR